MRLSYLLPSLILTLESCNSISHEKPMTESETSATSDSTGMAHKPFGKMEIGIIHIDTIWLDKEGLKKEISLEAAQGLTGDDIQHPTSFTIEYDTTNATHPYVKRCHSINEFHELVERPYKYGQVAYKCDVNQDGLDDYILEIFHENDTIRSNESDGYNDNNRGLILALNKGNYFETEHIYHCLLSEQIKNGYYEEHIEANKNRLFIEADFNSHSTKSYGITYRGGDYVLSEYRSIEVKEFIHDQSRTEIEFERNKMTISTRINADDENDGDESEEGYGTYLIIQYTIEPHHPLLLSKIGCLIP